MNDLSKVHKSGKWQSEDLSQASVAASTRESDNQREVFLGTGSESVAGV